MNTSTIQLQEGEVVISTIRRHWFHLAVVGCVDSALMIGLIVVLGLADLMIGHSAMPLNIDHSVALNIFVVAAIGLVLWMHFFAAWSDQWLDAWIITDRRIIDIEQQGFFHREVSTVALDRIQDVTYDTSGIIAMWLHFGDVQVHTASDDDKFILRQVPFPEDVKEHIVATQTHRSST
jgi:uncharacterized membrane protein YdbT with pleckstrin-like domain